MKSPCFCTSLRQASRALSAQYDAALEPLGINIAQYYLLRTVADHQSLSLSDLGRVLELDRSTIGRNVRVLERMELLRFGRSEEDQREAVVILTKTGAALLRKALPMWEQCQQAFVSRLGPKKAEALQDVLTMI
jgi:DNA-binding MarR family transcriptional regulator